jgi:hypothetical protein
MKTKKYYTVGTKWKTKNTTLSEQNEKQKILHCRNKMKNKNTTLTEKNENIFVFHFVQIVWYFLFFILFRKRSIFCFSLCPDSVVFFFHFVPTV